jgi:predicted ATPase/DNA-binding CsgD family transcriptional regulator
MVARTGRPISLRPRPDRTQTLPAQPTPLIGRDTDLQRLAAQLRDPEVRLLTLTGPPGVGKTRLAFEAAARLDTEFVDGICVVELAPLTDPSLVVQRIAGTLGLRDLAGRALAHLIQVFLEAKEYLLVLDNFEQVLDAAPFIAELIAACPYLTVLATSRAPLHLRAEHEFLLSPLTLPDLAHLPAPAAVAESAAVALFVARVRAVRPDFAVTAENARVIAQICHRLNGLPLALELAAARSKLLSPDSLLARLNHRLAILTDGAYDLPARQQTLRHAIAWSYDLLRPEEQSLFRRLSVFVGGCTIEAAEAICSEHIAAPSLLPEEQPNQPWLPRTPPSLRGKGAGGLGIPILDALTSLVDKSLLRQEAHAGVPRLSMLELVRDYGLEALVTAGEVDIIRQHHAEYFLALAEMAGQGLKGAEQRSWITTLDAEHDNLRAALEWAKERGEVEIALRLTSALVWYWHPRGSLPVVRRWFEGRRWIEDALALAANAGPTPTRAMALYGAGILAWRRGDVAAMASRFEEGLAIAQAIGDTRATAYAVSGLSMVAWLNGDAAAMQAHIEESLRLFEATDDDWGRAWHLCGVGIVAMGRGDAAAARARFTECLEIYQRLGDRLTSALPLVYLARLALRERDFAQARTLFEQSLALFQDVGNTADAAHQLCALASIARRQGEHDRAAVLCCESLSLCRDVGWKQGIALCLTEQALLWAAAGQPYRAARALGAAEALTETIALPIPAPDRIDDQAAIATFRAELDRADLSTARQQGRIAPIDDVIADALAPGHTRAEAGATPTMLSSASGRSRREVEVLSLLAGGQSNKEIAAALTLSIHTVERHLVNIYAKIGARGRADAVAFALRNHLVEPDAL